MNKLIAILFLTLATTASAFVQPRQKNPIFAPKTFDRSPTELSVALNIEDAFRSKFNAPLWSNNKVTVIDPDYKLASLFAFAAIFIYFLYPDQTCQDFSTAVVCPPTLLGGLCSFLHLWFGAFLGDRSSRVRVIFTDKDMHMSNFFEEKYVKEQDVLKADARKNNYVVGGDNKWYYKDIINYDFFPSVHMPILVYFKETKTPKSKWVVGPGKWDHRKNGMVHFFPAFGNSYQIQREFEKHGCKKI